MTIAAAEQAVPRGVRNVRHVRRTLSQCAWLFAIALFGYAIVGNLVSLLQIDSRGLTIPFRILVALFSVWVILHTPRLKADRLRKIMLVIWVLYIIRLLHDWLLPKLDGADYALQFFLVTSVLPAIALMKSQQYQNRQFAFVGFLVASAGALTSLMASLYGKAEWQSVAETGGRLALAAIDPVSLGNQAVSAVLCGIVLWRTATLRFRLFLACVFSLLLWCLLLTGSKGPALALLLCVGLWALRRGYALRFGLLAVPVLIWVVVSSQNPLAARLEGSTEDQSTVDRVVIFSDSLDQIAGSPLMGSAFVELNSGYYPHDVFVEAALAFGIPVALVFTGLIIVGAFRAWKTLGNDHDLLGLIFFQGLAAAAVSGSIYGSILLWVTLAMLPNRTKATRNSRTRPAGAIQALSAPK